MAGIYLHIPFCKQACHYCDFHFSTRTDTRAELLAAMVAEIKLQHNYLEGEPLQTIYFGGGTPSLLEEHELKLLMDAIAATFRVEAAAEITVEANPDDLTHPKLKSLKHLGVNRLSIGIQSFQNNVLAYLNRAHDSEAALSCVHSARAAGFDNISIDLIYAIPGQDENEWRSNIHHAIALAPEHISAYSLTIEDKTVFGRRAARGMLKAAADDAAASELEMLVSMLEAAGYEQYEVSNFSKPGFQSRHNSSYWRGLRYVGIGPSAHSYNLKSRQYNVSNNAQYVRALKEGLLPCTVERLSTEDHVNEYLLTTLRTAWGCDLARLRREFHYDILATHSSFIETLRKQGFIVIDHDILKLTRSGRLLADKISSDLFLVS